MVIFQTFGKSNPRKIINQILKNNINRIMAAPGVLNLISDYAKKNNIKIKTVKKIFTGGGAVFIDFLNKLKKVFENAEIISLYGSTEAEPIAEFNIKDLSKSDLEKIKNGFGILAGNIVRSRKMQNN